MSTHDSGVDLPPQVALDSPRVDMPPGLSEGEKRAFMLGVAAGALGVEGRKL